MRIGGQYVGIGLGDSSEEVGKIRDFGRRKFSYWKDLPDARNAQGLPLYDEAMAAAVAETQARYNTGFGQLATGKYVPGIVNYETKVVMGFIARPKRPDQRPMLFSVCGTGAVKGLEFDAVVVVEPGLIEDDAPSRLVAASDLYVAMTRPTQKLVIVRTRTDEKSLNI